MTEEIKNEETKECKCCQCREKLKEFLFKAGIVYVGVTLAIITSANILKPKCPCKLKRPYPGIERQLPSPMMHHRNLHKEFRGNRPDFGHKKMRGDRPNFEKAPKAPQLPQTQK
ncbi:hypothetical protein IJ541_04575 [bacterium]|nr:hypothetical protein [bacterium]